MKTVCYVVNLERATGRRKAIEAELEAAGITATFLGAVDIKEVGEDYLRQRFNDYGPWGIVPPQNMAICSSHLKIWDHFLATDADLAVVFEDDVYVAPELSIWLEDLSWWPKDADIVRLENWPSKSMKHVVGRQGPTFRGRKISRLYTRHPGSAGYIITRAHAQRLNSIERLSLTTDGLLFNPYVSKWARAAKIYQVNPALVTQGNDPSGEQTRRKQKQTGVKRWQQKLKRGWAELSSTPRHLFRIVTGQAELLRLSFSKEPLAKTTRKGDA